MIVRERDLASTSSVSKITPILHELYSCFSAMKNMFFMDNLKRFLIIFILQFIIMISQAQPSLPSDKLRISLSQLSEMEFEVRITNISQDIIPIAEPLYKLTSSSLYFILEDSSGAQMIFINRDNHPDSPQRQGRGIKNLLRTVILHPGKSFVTNVNLDSRSWLWPATFSIDPVLKLRVCYNYPRTKSGYWWSGRVVSTPIEWFLPMEIYDSHIMHLYE